LFALTLSCFVLWEAKDCVLKSKEILYLVCDWLEVLESDSHKCCCSEEKSEDET
jgi:hypothetical protein